MKPPIPTKSGGTGDKAPMPRGDSGQRGGSVPSGSEVRSNGPKGGKPPSNGTSAGLPRGR